MDTATGTESDGTRWTAEASFVEALHGLPVGGAEPLAFFSAFPYLIPEKVRWFGGITGTVGAAHTLQYYATTYNIQATFSIPRNVSTTIYRCPTVVKRTEEDHLNSIVESAHRWLSGSIEGLTASGPVLIVAESIEKAGKIKDKLIQRGHAETLAKELDGISKEGEPETPSWEVKTVHLSNGEVAHIFPLYRRGHQVMEELPDCAVVVASNKGGRGLDLKLDGKCPKECDIANHYHERTVTDMKSILYVILTDVLPDRQNEQAIGRCGRLGKAGVVEYQLLEEKGTSDPEALYLERLLRKHAIEQNDMGSKTNRIEQHRFDGAVLDNYCHWLPRYAEGWMKKLFPAATTNESSTSASNEEKKQSNAEKDENAKTEGGNSSSSSISALIPILHRWFLEHVNELWAYWRGYGGHRRKPGDILQFFHQRMGLVGPFDLPKPEPGEDDLHSFARRFWRFACVLHFSGEDLYSWVKTLLATEVEHPHLQKFCVEILRTACSSTNTAGGKSLKLIPEGDWKAEFSSNAAMMLAKLSKDATDIRRVECIIDELIKQWEALPQIPEHEQFPVFICDSGEKTRDAKNFYLVQRAEIVHQLKHRKQSLGALGSEVCELNHMSGALKKDDQRFIAYCLGFGWCQNIFEWFTGESPFTTPLVKTSQWMEHLRSDAEASGAPTKAQRAAGAAASGGDAQMETKEQKEKFEKQGAAISKRINTNKVEIKATEANSEEKKSAATLSEWKPTAPTVDDIAASEQRWWDKAKSWLYGMWVWIISLITGSKRKYKGLEGSASNSASSQTHVNSVLDPATKNALNELLRQHQKGKQQFTSSLVDAALASHASEITGLVAASLAHVEQSDIHQEEVETRTDGTAASDTSRSEAKAQADKAAEEPAHLRDESLAKEEKYLLNQMLEAVRKEAAEGRLDGFETQYNQMLEAITRFNDAAMSGKVDEATAKKMNAAMKAMWQSALSLALEHGDKLAEMATPLENYKSAQFVNKFKENVEYVTEKVTEMVKQVKKVAVDVIKYVWGWVTWCWGKVKTVGKKIVEVLEEIPIVRDVVNVVRTTIINPVYEVATRFFETASNSIQEAWKWTCGFVSSAARVVFDAVRDVAVAIGKGAIKIWNWLKETKLWKWIEEKTVQVVDKLVDGTITVFDWVFKAIKFVAPYFAKAYSFVAPYIATAWNWACSAVQWVISVLESTIIGAFFVELMRWLLKFYFCFVMTMLWSALVFVYKFVKYLWQGAGDITRDHVWGNWDFDIINVEKWKNGISRHTMRLRQALSRVWASSWIQYWLDPSLRLGLDLDEREHVQQRQEQAHQDYLRHASEQQKKTAFRFAVVGVILTALLLVGAIFSGGATLIPAIGLISAVLTTFLQYASMSVEKDWSLTSKEKETIQSFISVAQGVLMLLTLVAPFMAGSGAGVVSELEVAAGALTRVIGSYISKFAASLQKISSTIRAQQQVKGVLQQVDRLLRAVGIGGAAAIAMDLKNSALRFLDVVLDFVNSGIQALSQLFKGMFGATKMKEQQQEQQQEELEKEEDEEDEEDEKNKKDTTAVYTLKDIMELMFEGGMTMKKTDVHITFSTKADTDSGNPAKIEHHDDKSYQITTPGQETLTVTVVRLKDNVKEKSEQQQEQKELQRPQSPKIELVYSRKPTPEEEALFKNKSEKEIDQMFDEKSKEAKSVETTTSKSMAVMDKDKNIISETRNLTSPKGEVIIKVHHGKQVKIVIKPNVHPNPKPVTIDLRGKNQNFDGEMTADHESLLYETIFERQELDEWKDFFHVDENGVGTPKEYMNKEKKEGVTDEANDTKETVAQQPKSNAKTAKLMSVLTKASETMSWLWSGVENAPSYAAELVGNLIHRVPFVNRVMPYLGTFMSSLTKQCSALVGRALPYLASTKIGQLVLRTWGWASNSQVLSVTVVSKLAMALLGASPLSAAFLAWATSEHGRNSIGSVMNKTWNWLKSSRIGGPLEKVEKLKDFSLGKQSPSSPSIDNAAKQQVSPNMVAVLKNIVYLNLKKKPNIDDTTRGKLLEELRTEQDPGKIATQAANSMNERIRVKESNPAETARVAEGLAQKIFKNDKHKLSEEAEKKLKENEAKYGSEKAILMYLSSVAKQQHKENPKLGSALLTATTEGNPQPQQEVSDVQMLYEHMSNSGYCRHNMQFSTDVPKDLKLGKDAEKFVSRLTDATERGDVKVVGRHRVFSAEKIKADIENFVRTGDRRGLSEYVQQFLQAPTPKQIETVPGLKEEYERVLGKELSPTGAIMTQFLQLANDAWGQVDDEAVAILTAELVSSLSNSIVNVRVEWENPTLHNAIADENVQLLESFLNYKSDNKRNGHVQEALIAITFNNEAVQQGSAFRLRVNPVTNDKGGRDLLLIDIRTNESVGQFESKRYTSNSAKQNFAKFTDPEVANYYAPGTQVLVNEEKRAKLQGSFPDYNFESSLRVPDSITGGSIQLAADRSEALMNKITSLTPGQEFNMQGPRGTHARDKDTVTLNFAVDEMTGQFIVRQVREREGKN